MKNGNNVKHIIPPSTFTTTLLLVVILLFLFNFNFDVFNAGADSDSVLGQGTPGFISKWLIPPSPPTVSNVIVRMPDYCVSGPAATIEWTYSDPSPQQSYQVQVDDNNNFNSPTVDSCIPASGTCAAGNSSSAYFTGQGALQLNTRYYARVRAWNSYNIASNWVEMSSCVGDGNSNCNSNGNGKNWKTPQFPFPQANFTWTANDISENPSPPLNRPVTFTDTTVFGTGGGNNNFSLVFGDGGTSNNNNAGSSVNHTYAAEGAYNITITAKDNANQQCFKTRGPLILQPPIPRWREIAPK